MQSVEFLSGAFFYDCWTCHLTLSSFNEGIWGLHCCLMSHSGCRGELWIKDFLFNLWFKGQESSWLIFHLVIWQSGLHISKFAQACNFLSLYLYIIPLISSWHWTPGINTLMNHCVWHVVEDKLIKRGPRGQRKTKSNSANPTMFRTALFRMLISVWMC